MLIPPPSSVALLLTNVEPVISTAPPSVYIPPPPAVLARLSKFASPGRPIGGRSSSSATPAWLLSNKEFLTTDGRLLSRYMPPPSPFVRLFLTVRRVATRDVRSSL